jgi:aryl-alcohol dehydrogenase (NADP+)
VPPQHVTVPAALPGRVAPPGTDIGPLDQAYVPPAIQKTELRRRPLSERAA